MNPVVPRGSLHRHEQSAFSLWSQSRAASDDGQWSLGLRLAQRALRRLDEHEAPDPVLRSRILIALAYNNSELGHTDRARELLDAAATADAVLPAVRVARGLIMVRTGRPDAALADLDAAVAQLRVSSTPEALEDLAGALINRGLLHIVAGRLAQAAADTAAAGAIARELHRGDITFMADHNLGFVRYLAGDLPAALSAMEAAAAAWPRAAQDGVSPLDRARVLAAAGLIEAAGEHVDQALGFFRANRATADLVDAYSVRAELDLLAGDPDAASIAARRAEQTARRRGNTSAALAARTLRLQAVRAKRRLERREQPNRAGSLRRARADAADAARLVADLDAVGLVEEAKTARLLAAEALLDAGEVAQAAALAQEVRRRSGSRLATRLHGRLLDGQVELAMGDRRAGLAHIRRGLDDLSHFQATFGSQDLQAAAAVHGRELARLGLRTAVETGSPAAIFQWLERARGVSSRLRAVRPPADPEFARELGEFRAGYQQARQAVLTGRRDAALEARVRQQRRQVQTLAWSASGGGDVRRPLTLAAVRRRLAADPTDPTVIAYIRGDGVLHALVITARRATFRQLGRFDEIAQQTLRVGADLDLLAMPRIPQPVRDVAGRSLTGGLGRLSGALIGPIEQLIGAGPVLITGLGVLTTVPWGLLPSLAGRPVSVTASVTGAMAGRSLGERRVLTVAGPEVSNAAAEAEQIAALYPDASSLVDDNATGARMLAAIPDGGVLHIAAHGHHEVESPLFSWVQLADGPLYGYDIAPNPSLPDHVVLSSCDVGRSDDDRPGGEPLGLAAALLRSGVSTVIAGVSRIADDVAAPTMLAYHRRLIAGDGPARALATAIADVDGGSVALTCFGVGA
ncbi:CHAT domain-containing protein [Nakamurella panacisegetis]|uniref:CHAT domain-containing protein n=1 Tax=Nakamurella panacisegetis TaxID=1090615 RepID=A0A1H0RSE1_9ACTN|nr:CHAT domain-containing protein [Nakamurella panacisegetis]SDP32377.1 CHAT domain-containing protein [Nakamurella panacisegetis]